jgi:hypothetical protein
MNEFADLADVYRHSAEVVDLAALSLRLAETPCSPLYKRATSRSTTSSWLERAYEQAVGASRLHCIEQVAEHGEGKVETLLATTVHLVVGLGDDIADQLVEILRAAGQNRTIPGGSRPEHEELAVAVEQAQVSQGGAHFVADWDLGDQGGGDTLGARLTEVEERAFPAADDALVRADGPALECVPPATWSRLPRPLIRPTPRCFRQSTALRWSTCAARWRASSCRATANTRELTDNSETRGVCCGSLSVTVIRREG